MMGIITRDADVNLVRQVLFWLEEWIVLIVEEIISTKTVQE